MSYIDSYATMMRRKGKPFMLLDGQLFARKQQWITPIGPVAQSYSLTHKQCSALLNNLGGYWIAWTDGFPAHPSGQEWYAVICRQHIPLERITDGKRRNELRRALRECEVRKVDAAEIAEHGYETYCAALIKYRGSNEAPPSKSEFRRRVMTDVPFALLRHQWAVYCDSQMIAFAQNLIYDDIEADYTLIKLHPEYLKHYPAYALIYKMNEYYLAQEGFQYVNDGFRSISHDTGIQDFLIKKFGFEKAYTGLHVHYRPPLGQLIRLARPFKTVIARMYPNANALFELDRLRC